MDGVVELDVIRSDGEFIGSASVLLDGLHLLTAAHMVDDDFGNMVATQINVIFPVVGGDGNDIVYTINVQNGVNVFVNPGYNGDVTHGGDLAVLTLPLVAPAAVQRYDIARQNNANGQVFDLVGYGMTGTGAAGATGDPGTGHPQGKTNSKLRTACSAFPATT